MSTLQLPAPVVERRGFNWRLLVFLGVIAALLGYPVYLYLDLTLSGGIKDRGAYYEVDLKSMSSFVFDQEDGREEDVPQQFRELDGRTIEVRGEIAPGGLEARGVDAYFQLVFSVAKCCYSGRPQIQHFVQVTVPPDAQVASEIGRYAQPVRVKGELQVEVTRHPTTGEINGVYHIRAKRIEPV